MSAVPTLDDARALDVADPLARFRARFRLPGGVTYLDGNSLGPLPCATAGRIAEVVEREWGGSLIRSWNDHDWIGAAARIGGKVARLLGVAADDVVIADSTSVNLFKLLVAAARIAPGRGTIVTEAGNFPTDLHVARAAASLTGHELVVAERGRLADAIDARCAVAVLTHVHYRTGARFDLRGLTAHARERGARVLWDLSHSIGAVPLDLARDGVELAVGCGYKYLNGGPGAPAFLYAEGALAATMEPPIAGWLGHADPFAFAETYRPAAGVRRFVAGTPPILSLLALEPGVDLMVEAAGDALWAKAAALFDLFTQLAAAWTPALRLVTPRDPAARGSHVSFAHPDAFAIVQALIARGVTGDFRAPDVARFGLTPLFLSFADVWRACDQLRLVMAGEEWREPRHTVRGAVT